MVVEVVRIQLLSGSLDNHNLRSAITLTWFKLGEGEDVAVLALANAFRDEMIVLYPTSHCLPRSLSAHTIRLTYTPCR